MNRVSRTIASLLGAAMLASTVPAVAQTPQPRTPVGARSATCGTQCQGTTMNSPAVRLGNTMGGGMQIVPMRLPGENGTTLDAGRGAGTLTGFTRTSMTLRTATQTRTLMLDARTINALHLRLGDRVRFIQSANGSIFVQNLGIQGFLRACPSTKAHVNSQISCLRRVQ